MQGAKFVKIAVLTEKIGIFPVKFPNSRENNGVFLRGRKSLAPQRKSAQMYDFSRFVQGGQMLPKALPFGEGAPEGGGRGAVQRIVLLTAFGEFVLR